MMKMWKGFAMKEKNIWILKTYQEKKHLLILVL